MTGSGGTGISSGMNKKKRNRKRKNKEGKLSAEELNNLDLDTLCNYIENKGALEKEMSKGSSTGGGGSGGPSSSQQIQPKNRKKK